MARRSSKAKKPKAPKKRMAKRKRAPAGKRAATNRKRANAKKKRRTAGGAATASGMNFQAGVTAIVAIQLARGRPLHWLEGIFEDIPIALFAETGGSGDDIRIQFRNENVAEVQIKRGLVAGARLWDPLLALSKAINAREIRYGVLVVSPTSSRTIRDQLARDLVRIGDGRTDDLGSLASQLLNKLSSADIPVAAVCQRLRIVTLNALSEDAASIAAARAELAHICRDGNQVGPAWDRLYRDAGQLIENRGRRTAPAILRVLQSEGIELAMGPQVGPVALVAKLARWAGEAAATFSILGAERPFAIDASWIPLKVVVREDEVQEVAGLVEALSQYHNWSSRDRRNCNLVDSETIGRFIRHTVVVAGPGMGKSVLHKKLARCYSADGYPVLRVSLASIAVRMRATGSSFTESLFELGLDGFDVPAADVVRAGIVDWVLLCDGLDECGADQENVAQAIHDYVAGHPHCRVIVTTRPVGYRSTLLRAWRHYEIFPIETSSAKKHLGDLISEIASAGLLARDAWDIAGAALESNDAEGVIARSPLLLGMAAVILARGKTLGRSKADLYSRMFELIDELPNTRNPIPPSTPGVLHRFLNLLGWNTVANPTAQTFQLAGLCAKPLSAELQIPLLRAAELVENCITYWQAAGTIERVRHGELETLTFIHKTFGEFAAARFLVAAEDAEQRLIVGTVLTDESWVEVLTFAGSLGIADLVASSFLSNLSNTTAGVALLNRALTLIAEVEPPPDDAIRHNTLKAAFMYVSGDRRSWAYSVGEALKGVADRFPVEVGPFAAAHLNAEHVWTRIVALTCALIAGPTFYSLNELVKQFEAVPSLVDYGFRRTLGGGLPLVEGNSGIVQHFIVAATKAILDRCPAELTEKILPPIINNTDIQTWGTHEKIRELLETKNRAYMIVASPAQRALAASLVGSGDYSTAHRLAFQKVLESLLETGPTPPEAADLARSTQLIHISAFFHLTKFLKSPAYDVWAWSKPYDAAAVQEVFRGIVGIAPIGRTELLVDAQTMLGRLGRLPDDDVFKVWRSIASVDVPDFNEEKAKAINLNFDLLELAIYHRSNWLVRLALYLFILAADATRLKAATIRLLADGKDATLFAAAHMAEQLGAGAAIALACDRLTKPLVSGCEHLFELLHRLKPPPDETVLAAIANGLMAGDEDTAVAAGALANELESPPAEKLLSILNAGYDHWLKHEKPYPRSGGTVPRSPRGKLLMARLRIEDPTIEALFDYAADTRSDVSNVAVSAIMQKLKDSAEARASFVDAIMDTRSHPGLLREALNQNVPFLPAEVERLCGLLEAADAKLRYAALALLSEKYLAKERLEDLARLRLSDTEQDIREGAYRALERLATATKTQAPAGT